MIKNDYISKFKLCEHFHWEICNINPEFCTIVGMVARACAKKPLLASVAGRLAKLFGKLAGEVAGITITDPKGDFGNV